MCKSTLFALQRAQAHAFFEGTAQLQTTAASVRHVTAAANRPHSVSELSAGEGVSGDLRMQSGAPGTLAFR